ncbi:MAG: dihydroneopterin aldolase [Verrucomicrobiota bacterium]
MLARIELKNMVFYGYHGALPEEATLGQRFSMDLVLTLDIGEAAATDDLTRTVDYGAVYGLVRGIVERERAHLLERLAAHVLQSVLDEHPRVLEVKITLRKPSVPIAGNLDHVAIETSLTRDDRPFRSGK